MDGTGDDVENEVGDEDEDEDEDEDDGWNMSAGDWRFIAEAAHDGPTNMALDVVAGETAAATDLRTVRVYRWVPSTLSLGYAQSETTVDWDRCDRWGIDVVRRPTGGGGIYHDSFGDISYSIAIPADSSPGDLMEAYRLLCEPIFDAFRRLGIEARFADAQRPAILEPSCYLRGVDPAHDIVVETDGIERKISGNAQYRRRDAVIQHGSISYVHRPSRHLSVFTDHAVDVDTFRDRTTDILSLTNDRRSAAVEAIESALSDWANAAEGTWTRAELDRADTLVERTFDTENWTRNRVDPATEIDSNS